MIRSRLTLTLVLTGVFIGAPAAQVPTFTGTWTLESSQSNAPAGAPAGGGGGLAPARGGGGLSAGGARMGGGGGGQTPEISITQTATELVIERLAPSPMKWTYKLDGSESVNTNGRTTTRTRSRWEGRTLVTEGTQTVAMDGGDVKGTVREVRSIDADGRLVLETTRTAEGRTSPPTVTTQTYRKK